MQHKQEVNVHKQDLALHKQEVAAHLICGAVKFDPSVDGTLRLVLKTEP